ncbi:MAG: ABC transporter permease [Candidatus Aminicenantes bacterium]|nr:ABC transporter permease [Candidatus Aminicenantes bacterium]
MRSEGSDTRLYGCNAVRFVVPEVEQFAEYRFPLRKYGNDHHCRPFVLNSFWTNKLRTFLTLLGIIIGVLTIIAVISIIQGLNDYVYDKIAIFGTNDFSVSKYSFNLRSLKEWREQIKRKNLSLEDMMLIRRQCKSCTIVGASIETEGTVKYGNKALKGVSIAGQTHLDHMIGSVLELERGRHIMKGDEDHSRYVCVIGADVKEHVFAGLDPLGKRLKIGYTDFLIIGIGEKKGKIFGDSLDDFTLIPMSTFQKIYGTHRSLKINVHTVSQEQMAAAQEEVRTILRSKRHVPFDKKDDFSFMTSETLIEFYQNATSGIYFAMIAIASMALLVGGVVVMNIMLVSVTERTKEIGVRMAVGARRRDILIQFLIESAAISAAGGIIGIVLGFTLAKVVSYATSLPASLNPFAIILSILVSASVGIFFGLYPANKAAKLNPIDALRSEQ